MVTFAYFYYDCCCCWGEFVLLQGLEDFLTGVWVDLLVLFVEEVELGGEVCALGVRDFGEFAGGVVG